MTSRLQNVSYIKYTENFETCQLHRNSPEDPFLFMRENVGKILLDEEAEQLISSIPSHQIEEINFFKTPQDTLIIYMASAIAALLIIIFLII